MDETHHQKYFPKKTTATSIKNNLIKPLIGRPGQSIKIGDIFIS
jgi:hypothetical protein